MFNIKVLLPIFRYLDKIVILLSKVQFTKSSELPATPRGLGMEDGRQQMGQTEQHTVSCEAQEQEDKKFDILS